MDAREHKNEVAINGSQLSDLYNGTFDESKSISSVFIPQVTVDRQLYTITFETGSTGTVESIQAMGGQMVALPDGNSLVNNGNSFGGWNVVFGEKQGTHYNAGELLVMPEENMTLTDAWGHVELDPIKGKLLKTGFKETAFIEERDTYFDNQQGDIRANGEALRVRETKDHLSGKRRAQINFKGKKLDDCTMTREELETGMEDGAVCRNILRAIGYMPAEPGVIKDRVMLQKGRLTACLDNVHGLGEFLELEILADSEDERETALGQIGNILNSLGYQISDTVRTSYLSMLQNRKQA